MGVAAHHGHDGHGGKKKVSLIVIVMEWGKGKRGGLNMTHHQCIHRCCVWGASPDATRANLIKALEGAAETNIDTISASKCG